MLRNMTKIEKSDGKNLLHAKSRASIQAPSFPSASQGTVESHERSKFVQIGLCKIELSGEISSVAIEYFEIARSAAFVSHIR